MAVPRPEAAAMSSERLRRIDDLIQHRYIDTGRLPCATVLVARSGKIVHSGILGWADIERNKRVRENTLFRIYSMTKPMTSVLFMMLVEEGKVALYDRVDSVIPTWKDLAVYSGGSKGAFVTEPCARPMQMVDLLRHTSGLTYGYHERTAVDAAYRDLGIGASGAQPSSLETTIEHLAGLPLEFSPGTAFNYSVSTDVLGYLIQKIEGRPFEQVMKDRLIEPLGMVDTDFFVPSHKADRFAACYQYRPEEKPELIDDPLHSSYLKPPVFVSGGGGLVSTTADYFRFCSMLLNRGELSGRRYLSPKTLSLMLANHLPDGKDLTETSVSEYSDAPYAGIGFGLGFAKALAPVKSLSASTKGEYFWGGAASTTFWIDPLEELIVIFMTQLSPSNAYPIPRELRTLVYAAMTEAYV